MVIITHQVMTGQSTGKSTGADGKQAMKELAGKLYSFLCLAAAATVMVAIYLVFVHAPMEASMGIVQKIFYFHVPSAFITLLMVGVLLAGSLGYLIRRTLFWDEIGVTAAEVGLLFSSLVLLSGPLWAKGAWSIWWTWDPRLTTMLILWLLLIGHKMLRNMGGSGDTSRIFSAVLGIFAAADAFLVHFSVKLLGGQHQTVLQAEGNRGGIDPDMVPALVVSILAMTLLSGALFWARLRQERLQNMVNRLLLKMSEHGWSE